VSKAPPLLLNKLRPEHSACFAASNEILSSSIRTREALKRSIAAIEEGQFFYEAVDLASCMKYLDQVADPDDWDEFENECANVTLNDRLYEEKEAWYQDSSIDGQQAMHVASPKGSIARAIEQNLLRDDAADRLDTVVFETVAERVQAASEYYRRVLQNREDRIAGLLNSWKEA